MQVVNVNYGELLLLPADAMALRVFNPAANQMSYTPSGSLQAAEETGLRTGSLVSRPGVQLGLDQRIQLVKVFTLHCFFIAGQARLYAVDQRREAAGFLVGLSKEEAQEALFAEFFHGPAISCNALGTGAGFRDQLFFIAAHRRKQPHAGKGSDGQSQALILSAGFRLDGVIGGVEKQQVFAFDVENQCMSVGLFGAEKVLRLENTVQQKSGIGSFGGHARYSGDVYVSATAAVEELEITVHDLLVAGESQQEALLHGVKEECLLTVSTGGLIYGVSGQRRDEDFRLDAGDSDVSFNGYPQRKNTLFGEEDIGLQPGAFVAC